jgi:hypothetical protein
MTPGNVRQCDMSLCRLSALQSSYHISKGRKLFSKPKEAPQLAVSLHTKERTLPKGSNQSQRGYVN